MISAGCTIHGTVENSVLAPGVIVEKGAVVKDSILFADCVVEKNSRVDLAIFDKRARVEAGAQVGVGTNHTLPNSENPKHLYTGISLIGKGAVVPADTAIGRNCIINSHTTASGYPGKIIADGLTI